MFRRSAHLAFALALAAACTSIAVTPASAEWPHDPYTGHLPVCTAADWQTEVTAVADGFGGSIVVWRDYRAGNYDVYANRITADGVPLWGANGIAVCTNTGTQFEPQPVADGTGGAIIGWTDYRSGTGDIYAQRVTAAGTVAWTANGVAVCSAANTQSGLSITADDAGGAVLVWSDIRSGTQYDIYAQRINSSGAAQWTANGVGVCTLVSDQAVPRVIWNSTGAVIAWQDYRNADPDLYAQRLNSSGTAQWAANGINLSFVSGACDDPNVVADGGTGTIFLWSEGGTLRAQRLNSSGGTIWGSSGFDVAPGITSVSDVLAAADGQGGAFVAWRDPRATTYDAYTQHLSPAGARLWSATGVLLSSNEDSQQATALVPDGTGGVLVSIYDLRGPSAEVFAQRVSAAGSVQWGSGGTLVSGAPGGVNSLDALPDGSGGALLFWSDGRNGPNDVFVQRVEPNGQLGDPAPSIVSVKDVAGDQGGFVRLTWDASYLDDAPGFAIVDYRIWRSVPQGALAALAARRGVTADSDEAATGGMLFVSAAAADYAWEYVGTQTAAAFPSYSFVTATTADSSAGFTRRTVFMIEARNGTAVSSKRWASAPDSGYSVDNLAPAMPAPLTGQYSAGTTRLYWNPNHEADLAGYRVYRGTSASFTPSPATLVEAVADTGYADAAGAPYFYKLTAVDVHGNESPVAMLQPSGALDVPGAAGPALAFAAPWPQPARAGAVQLRFSLAVAGEATLELFDASGRRLRTLASGHFAAGEHVLRWDGLADGGAPAAPGLYLARLSAGGRELVRRVVMAR